MYDAVFSALMTLTGLSFAALGLLLERRERHWIRHARVWKSLRILNLLPLAVAVVATSTVVLVRIDKYNEQFDVWWWLTILLFGASLALIAWTLVRTQKLMEPSAILVRMRKTYFSDRTVAAWDKKSDEVLRQGISEYFTDLKELLTGTLAAVDLNGYGEIHSKGLVELSDPRTGLKDCGLRRTSRDLRTRTVGTIAVESLGEARAQFDAFGGNRAVNLDCAETFASIAAAWEDWNEDPRSSTDDEVRRKVLMKCCQVATECLEMTLGVPRPSATLIKELARTVRLLQLAVDPETRFRTFTSVLGGYERAVLGGNTTEAGLVLNLLGVDFVHLIAERSRLEAWEMVLRAHERAMEAGGPEMGRPVLDLLSGPFLASMGTETKSAVQSLLKTARRMADAGDYSAATKVVEVAPVELLKGLMGESAGPMSEMVMFVLDEHRRPLQNRDVADSYSQILDCWVNGYVETYKGLRNKLLDRVIPELVDAVTAVPREIAIVRDFVPSIVDDHKLLESLLLRLQTADDRTCQEFLKHIYASPNLAKRRKELLKSFLQSRMPNAPDDSMEAAEVASRWLSPVAESLVMTAPESLKLLRDHAKSVHRGRHSDDAVVSPFYLSMIFPVVVAENRNRRTQAPGGPDEPVAEQNQSDDQLAPAPSLPTMSPGTLSDLIEGERLYRAPVKRVPVSALLWQIFNVLENGLEHSEKLGSPTFFSAEVRRSSMGALSYVLHAVDDGTVDDLAELLLDKKLVRSIEIVFKLGVGDLGDVSLYIDRLRAAAEAATGLDPGKRPDDRSVWLRWHGIRLLCEAAYADSGSGRPSLEDHESGKEEQFSGEQSSSDLGLTGVIDGIVNQIWARDSHGAVDSGGSSTQWLPLALSVSKFLNTKLEDDPEVQLWRAMDAQIASAGANAIPEDLACALCAAVLNDLIDARLPYWAANLMEEHESAVRETDLHLSYVLLRAVRSCFKRVDGSNDRVTFSLMGPRYVFKDELIPEAELHRAGAKVMEALVTDWLTEGIDVLSGGRTDDEVLRKEINAVVGKVRDAMKNRFEGAPNVNVKSSDKELEEVRRWLLRRPR